MTKYESAKKAKSDAETQQKKLQQANKVFFIEYLLKNRINHKFIILI
jgi:hypothetical protein